MPELTRKLGVTLSVFLLAALLTGCWLRLASGNVIYVADIAEEVNEIITTVFSDSTATVCLPTDYGFYECTYIVEGEIITSSLYLLSELGLAGVLIDPLILQVPEDTLLAEATYDDGSGAQTLVTRQAASFEAQPGLPITAEAGQKFFILELPANAEAGLPSGSPFNGAPFDLNLVLRRFRPINEPVTAQSIKAMFTAKVVVNGHSYYAPALPCVLDFASIPAIQVPLAGSPQDLMPAIHSALQSIPQAACDHKGYYYDAAPPPFSDWLYLPWVGG